jgi:hypothetical protein
MTIADKLREIADNQEKLQNLLAAREYQEDGNLRLVANRAFTNCAQLRESAKLLDEYAEELDERAFINKDRPTQNIALRFGAVKNPAKFTDEPCICPPTPGHTCAQHP